MRTRVGLLAALLALLALVALRPAAAQTNVDLELVIAVDISMSMDPEEQRLQREGYLEAFRDANVQQAIVAGRHRKIAVTYIEWAGPQAVQTLIPWRVLDGRAAIEAFVGEMAALPYRRASRTSISAALVHAAGLFDTGFRGSRQVIDVSGDGVNNSGPLLSTVRPGLLDRGIVINGLPILVRPSTTWTQWDAPDLDLYYANCVIGGPGSFSIPILTREDFIPATRQKILLEIAAKEPEPRLVRTQSRAADPDGFDCGLVERRLQFFDR